MVQVFLWSRSSSGPGQTSVVSLVSPPSDAAVEVKSSSLISLTSLICVVSSPAGQTNITAELGHDVSLPCRAGHDGDIDAVEWTRPDLESEYVLFYRDGHLDPDHQHPSFQNRVDLQDRQMKDGNVSLILKKVMTKDTGTYECRVFQRRTGSMIAESKSIIIHLEVSPPGTTQDGGDKDGGDKDGGHHGLVVGLLAAVIVGIIGMVVGFWIYKRLQKKNSAPSSSSFTSRDEGGNESEANILCVEAPTDQEKHQNS
ncbi:uncharacterized protein LOC121640499 [Melanotaenia boesemani]|uniref:uncharacterized protein LOC121640499 n=1 Tax=Melanotaenia boesemani TaxID=1250792 RepID=UPI001C05D7EA|nr:uncharacterized protein LOC121640499 [Melanotaenia boesemani]